MPTYRARTQRAQELRRAQLLERFDRQLAQPFSAACP